MNLLRAKELAWSAWFSTLQYIRTKPKCKDYGNKHTIDTLWDALPEQSKNYWLERSYVN